MPTLLFKYIIIGDSKVGKSAFLLQFTDRQFRTAHDVTIGVEFGSKDVMVGDTKVKLEIWDTAGQEAFQAITRSYYRGTDGCLLMYDISRRDTFMHVERWINEARSNANNPQLVIMLLANKVDLEDKRVVSREEGEALAKKLGVSFMEASARHAEQVEEAFIRTAEKIFEDVQLQQRPAQPPPATLKLGQGSFSPKKLEADCCQ